MENSDNIVKEKWRFFKITFPIIKSVLTKRKFYILYFILISVVLGIIPVMKSELESGIISTTNDVMDLFDKDLEDEQDEETRIDNSITTLRIDRFSTVLDDEETDWIKKITYFFFRDISILKAIFLYSILALLTYYLYYLYEAIQSNIRVAIFTKVRTEGLRKGLYINPYELPSLKNIAGQYSAAIHRGTNSISNTYEYTIDIVRDLFSLLTILVLLLSKSIIFAFIIFGFAFIQLLISRRMAKKLQNARNELDERYNALLGQTDEILSKRELLLAYEQQERYSGKLINEAETYAKVGRGLQLRETFYKQVSRFIDDFGRIAILGLAVIIFMMLSGDGTISNVGDAYFLISMYSRINSPIHSILRKYDSIKRSEDVSNSFLDILTIDINRIDQGAIPHLDLSNGIRFSNVSFFYQSKDNTISNCSFNIPFNKTTLLLGPSGSGKSTIAKILLGFYPITNGKILLGEYDISSFSPEELRDKMSYVAQNDYVINDSIFENLIWGKNLRQDTINDEMIETLEKLGVSVKQRELELQSSSKILSIGQQQRISLARMLLDKSEIAILDEPLSGVDIFQINKIIPLLKEELNKNKRTVLLISHNLSFVSCADHLVILDDDGTVLEEGPPSYLINSKSTFATLIKVAKKSLSLSPISKPFEANPSTVKQKLSKTYARSLKLKIMEEYSVLLQKIKDGKLTEDDRENLNMLFNTYKEISNDEDKLDSNQSFIQEDLINEIEKETNFNKKKELINEFFTQEKKEIENQFLKEELLFKKRQNEILLQKLEEEKNIDVQKGQNEVESINLSNLKLRSQNFLKISSAAVITAFLILGAVQGLFYGYPQGILVMMFCLTLIGGMLTKTIAFELWGLKAKINPIEETKNSDSDKK